MHKLTKERKEFFEQEKFLNRSAASALVASVKVKLII
jgi:hypothetical protein